MIEDSGMVKLIDMGSIKIFDRDLHKAYLRGDDVDKNKKINTESDIWRNEAMSVDGNTFVGTEG